MRKIKLTREEKEIEDALLKGEYVSISEEKFKEIAQAIERRKKDTVLNIRVNSYDLNTAPLAPEPAVCRKREEMVIGELNQMRNWFKLRFKESKKLGCNNRSN